MNFLKYKIDKFTRHEIQAKRYTEKCKGIDIGICTHIYPGTFIHAEPAGKCSMLLRIEKAEASVVCAEQMDGKTTIHFTEMLNSLLTNDAVRRHEINVPV